MCVTESLNVKRHNDITSTMDIHAVEDDSSVATKAIPYANVYC